MAGEVDIKSIWNKVVDQVKQKVIHPTLWRALEIAVPITIDKDQFVVGFPSVDFNMSGHLTSADHRNAIERALREYSGMALSLRIIDGTTAQDWLNVKVKEESMSALQEADRKKRESDYAVTQSWEGLYEQVGRKHASIARGQLPQARANYVVEIIKEISDAMDQLMPAGRPTNELADRSLGRVLDRVGSLTGIPSPMVALELKRYRDALGK
jgi:hypothetical protein